MRRWGREIQAAARPQIQVTSRGLPTLMSVSVHTFLSIFRLRTLDTPAPMPRCSPADRGPDSGHRGPVLPISTHPATRTLRGSSGADSERPQGGPRGWACSSSSTQLQDPAAHHCFLQPSPGLLQQPSTWRLTARCHSDRPPSTQPSQSVISSKCKFPCFESLL